MSYTPSLREEINKALDEATPGPWKAETHIAGAHVKASAQIALCAENGVISVNKIDNQHIGKNKCIANAHLIANSPTWLRAQQEEIARLTVALHVCLSYEKTVSEMHGENERLLAELEQVKAERDQYRSDANKCFDVGSEIRSLRTELSAKDEVLKWYAGHRFDDGERARTILSQYPPSPIQEDKE